MCHISVEINVLAVSQTNVNGNEYSPLGVFLFVTCHHPHL
jgi:hypothetical protein